MSASSPRPAAVLIARSMARAHHYAVDVFGWCCTGQNHYCTPDGEVVHAVPDRSAGFVNRPRGTRAYLLPNWLLRDDQRDINDRLADGRLVQVSLPRVAQ
jgi:hypothetical protein